MKIEKTALDLKDGEESQNWCILDGDTVMQTVSTSVEGLDGEEAMNRMRRWGPNRLYKVDHKGKLKLLAEQFKEIGILVLIGAAVVSAVLGDFSDAIVILIIVFINALLGFYQQYRAEKALDALKKTNVTKVTVRRNGAVRTINQEEIVVGDIVLLEAGVAVPADLRILEAAGLRVEESALTGESAAVEKSSEVLDTGELVLADKLNMAFKGTFVAAGRGLGVVVATGMNTEFGKIAQMVQRVPGLTPLQLRMAKFTKRLSVIIIFLCTIFFISGWLRGEGVSQMLLTSISLAVAAIPEALPAVISISLALAARKMVKKNALIRKLHAVETLGSVKYICTDKTGTLTRNQMQVSQIYCQQQWYQGDEIAKLKTFVEGQLLLSAFRLNNDSFSDASGQLKGEGTELALMRIAEAHSPEDVDPIRLAELPFDSVRKLMSTFHHINGKVICFTKGAPEMLLPRCNDVEKEKILQQVQTMAEQGNRVMGFAYRYFDHLPQDINETDYEQDLIFLGLAGMIDPIREGVIEAIAECHAAGVVPVMITGDHIATATSIARQVGIITHDDDLVVTGSDLTLMDDEVLRSKVSRIKVYARVSPEQKLRIVNSLQSTGNFVAMTGDGINDSPSLNAANIGIAMGISGTDVAKASADMVLLDDNFASIIPAIRAGRQVYDNILKLIKYLLTTNSSELLTILMGPMLGLPVALMPIHILWINLVSDGLPAIALSYEKEEENIMRRPPRDPDEDIFSQGRGFHMLWIGVMMAGIALSAHAWAYHNGLHWQTIVFNILCLSQMGHALSVRSERLSLLKIGLWSNPMMMGSVLLALISQALVTYVPFLQDIFHTQALSMEEFIVVGVASLMVFLIMETSKYLKYRRNL